MTQEDFFISYSRPDRKWAEWIAWQLQDAGYRVVFQARDIRPGNNWIRAVNEALQRCRNTVAVLSPDYLRSPYCAMEWQAALQAGLGDRQRRLIPLRVAECEPDGLLAGVVYFDLIGVDDEGIAREVLLHNILPDDDRGFRQRPEFPAAPPAPDTAVPPREPVPPDERPVPSPPTFPPARRPAVRLWSAVALVCVAVATGTGLQAGSGPGGAVAGSVAAALAGGAVAGVVLPPVGWIATAVVAVAALVGGMGSAELLDGHDVSTVAVMVEVGCAVALAALYSVLLRPAARPVIGQARPGP